MLDKTRDANSLLAIVGRDVLEHDKPLDTPFLQRVMRVARASGYDVDLFHVYGDIALSQRLFQSDPEVEKARRTREKKAAARLAEIALQMRGAEVDCSFDVHVDEPDDVSAILAKIEMAKPALVMKQAEGQDYILGLMSNTDWALTRQSPCNIWFVPDDDDASDERIDRILTAIGNVARDRDIISEADYQVFRTAEQVSRWFDADNIPVHAYQVPEPLQKAYRTYAPLVNSEPQMVLTDPLPEAQKRVAEEHGARIRDFAEYFGISPEKVELIKGHPIVALPRVAESTDANLLVMGARDLARWERIIRDVTAEPVLARTTCDVLFVKDDAPEPEALDDVGAAKAANASRL